MASFTKNVAITQTDPTVQVEVAATNALPLGVNRFQLVVVDDAGNESAPAFIDVIVKDTEKPTAVLDMVDANGAIVQPTVAVGASFILSGKRSSDTGGGKVVSYKFTLIDPPPA
jgi:hypothetical protein